MATYAVYVERLGQHFASLHVNATEPMLACEAAERIVCQAAEGNLDNLPDYFANKVEAA